jgi:glycosyltransferase involved in cell wall biosynthesis
LTLLPELRRLGVECHAAVGPTGPLAGRLRDLGFAVHEVDLWRARTDPTAPVRLARILREVRPDLAHWHGTRAAFFGALARPLVLRPPPSVYTVHVLSYRKEINAASRTVYLAAELIACRAAARVIAICRADLEDLLRRRFVASERVELIRNAVDLDRFSPGDREAARARLGLPQGAMLIGTVSRLFRGKGVGDLIEAAALVPDVTLVVVGDGPEQPALEARARALGAPVRFLGARDDVPDVLRAFDAFALASRWEAEGIALLEAMAVGLPCVATATDGAREVLEGTGAGILVGVGAPQALASAFRELAAAPFHRAQMGQAARAAVGRRSPEALGRAVLGAYERALGR